MTLANGPNRILEQLDGVPCLASALRLSDAKSDLSFLFSYYASAQSALLGKTQGPWQAGTVAAHEKKISNIGY
jgi:hypothetical protein